jgi:outer membrane protein OmpA-like peptidoglycan-associated protein
MIKIKITGIITVLLFCMSSFAQTDSVKTAPVIVNVTNSKKIGRKGETVIFIAQKNKQYFTYTTDAAGKVSVKLPAGEDYAITIKTLHDSSKVGNITIPSLNKGEYFSNAFTVTIVYEPARVFTLNNLHFDFAKAVIRSESYHEMDELYDYLKWKDDIKIEIAGHTDNVGTDAANLVLSQQRADAVRNYLIKKGISPTRVTAKGYGASEPVEDNITEEGRQKNRRTEVKLL